ncbi:Patatin-like phospholipase/acyl hydrolase [Muriicola jejuensis]|nr:Patatin-like phospholipase/acyl hydrolase [Muriicola jejuensis]
MKKPTLVFYYSMLLFLFISCSKSENNSQMAVAETPRKTIVLAIDGGGIKGLIPALILKSIEDSIKKQSFQIFDLIGGNSTGGIIAVGLTSKNNVSGHPFSAAEISSIYETNGDKIFVPQKSLLREKYYAKYYAVDHRDKGIEPYLQSLVGSTTKLRHSHAYIRSLKDTRVKQMFTTSYIVNSKGGKIENPVINTDSGPFLFNWYDADSLPNNRDYYLWEAARGSSAAPIYFPIAHVGGNTGDRSDADEKWVVDGGVMSNDPAVWGVSEALRTGLAKRLEDIIVISLGTGIYRANTGVGITNQRDMIPKSGNWGEGPWMGIPEAIYNLEEEKTASLMYIMMDAVQLVSDSQMKAFEHAGLKYLRLEPSLALEQAAMDNIDSTNIKSLKDTVEHYLAGDGRSTFKEIINILKNQ